MVRQVPPAFPDVVSGATLARQRVLPVAEPLQSLLPAGGLVRGQALASRGVAAASLALALVSEATAAGSWLAVVDVPSLSLEAVEEFGIALDRVVRIDPGGQRRDKQWAELVAAAIDGFELIVTRVPPGASGGWVRKVQSRLQAKEAVLLALGAPGAMSCAVELLATEPRWEGVGDGHGHLRGRQVTVVTGGRRMPQQRRCRLWLPAPHGRVELVESVNPLPADVTAPAEASARGA